MQHAGGGDDVVRNIRHSGFGGDVPFAIFIDGEVVIAGLAQLDDGKDAGHAGADDHETLVLGCGGFRAHACFS